MKGGKLVFLMVCMLAMAAVELLAPAISQSATTAKSKKGIIVLRQGSQTVKFATTKEGFILGLSRRKPLKPEDIKEVRFNSDRVGWGKFSVAFGKFNIAKKRAYIKVVGVNCERLPTPNNDTGQWTVVLRSGKIIWFNLDQWKFSGLLAKRVKTERSDLMRYGEYEKEHLKFDPCQKSLHIDFNSNVLSGLMKLGVDPEDVDRIVWSSDNVGWLDRSNVFSLLEREGNGNFFVHFSNMPNSDKGDLSVRLKGGEHVFLNVDLWKIDGGRVVTSSGSKFIVFGEDDDHSRPHMEFDSSDRELKIRFNTSVLAGMVEFGLDPSRVTGVFWNSNQVGWMDTSTKSAPLKRDSSGDLFAELSGMPATDKGNVSVRMTDGTHHWANIDSWEFEGGNVSLDHVAGQLEYHF